MRATFTLSDEQFAANDRAGILIGLPLSVQIATAPLVLGREAGIDWFEPAPPGRTLLRQVSLERHAFSGQLMQMETWGSPEGTIGQALLDCGLPLRLDLFDPAQEPRHAGTPFDLKAGDWVLGLASLQGLLALDPGDLLWQTSEGTIVDVQRLCLSPLDPSFGTLRWLHGLAANSFAPDLVIITLDLRTRT